MVGDDISEAIQVEIDDQGDIVIPARIRKRLGLMKGMTLIAEDGEQGQLHLRIQQVLPQVIEDQGVLVVTSPLSPDLESNAHLSHSLTDTVRRHREQRLNSLLQSIEQ